MFLCLVGLPECLGSVLRSESTLAGGNRLRLIWEHPSANVPEHTSAREPIVATEDQLSMFSVVEEMQLTRSIPKLPDSIQITEAALVDWKQRLYQFQHQVRTAPAPEQATLFALAPAPNDPQAIADGIDPFSLPQQNTEFWRWKYDDEGVAALYFVVDYHLPILLYVGETVKSNQRWKGEHDCKRYLQNYVSAHYPYQLPVQVNIGFWSSAPTNTRARQNIELALIHKWRSPFNKENWSVWNTPFIGGKFKTT